MSVRAIEITGFTNAGGPLSKRISLAPDGTLKSDGSACVMSHGTAQRVRIADVEALADVVGRVRTDQALALGALRRDLPDRVEIVTKRQLALKGNGVARTAHNIVYRRGEPAMALADYDRKGMPEVVADAVRDRGGLWPTLVSIVPALRRIAHLIRVSTSSGLIRADTGAQLAGSGGLHVYVAVKDGSDIERFLKNLHARCWLAGFGWFIVGTGGQMLERSIVDRMVYAPERLVFEGAPILEPPLRQDIERRRPVPTDGDMLDTRKACPDLDVAEHSRLGELKIKAAAPLKGAAAKLRHQFEERQAQALAARTGITISAARRQVARQCEGILLPDIVLPFDDEEFAGCTVGDVLADPARFEGATLADPLEGFDYGACVARVMRRDDGTPWVHSFAHGRTVYELRHSACSVQAAIDAAPEAEAAKALIEMLPVADLATDDQERLRIHAAERAGLGRRDINRMLKTAQQEHAAKRKQEARERRARERTDPRPQIARPAEDADWLPQMRTLNAVIAKSSAPHPAARDIDAATAQGRQISLPKMHAFITSN